MTPTTAIASTPVSGQELTELRKMGYRRTEDDDLLVHRACGDTVNRGEAKPHHDACRFVGPWNMGYTRVRPEEGMPTPAYGYLHMLYGCPTNDPGKHNTECTENRLPSTY